MIYPWQQNTWQQLTRNMQENRLPHALLFVGETGIGKKKFALTLAKTLLCFHAQKSIACGNCQSCHLFAAQTHPDLIKVESEPGHAIKIDQIREVTASANQTALMGGYRVIIIDPASAMNINAANALLKTLEEPTPNTLLILIGDQTLNLPATILSRCQRIIFQKPSLEQSLVWLKENITDESVNHAILLNSSHGAPLAALEFFKQGTYAFRQDFYNGLSQLSESQIDPVELAERWHEKDFELILFLCFSWVTDLLRLKATQDNAILVNADFQVILTRISQKLSFKQLLSYSDHIQKTYRFIHTGLNLNQRLLLEELFIKWVLYAVR